MGGVPTFFGAGALSAHNSGTTIGPVAFPANTQADDYAILFAGAGGAATTFTTPTGGWAVLGTSQESDAGQSTEWYWLRLSGAGSNPSITSSSTFSNTNGGYGQIFVFRGLLLSGTPHEQVGNAGTVSTNSPQTTAMTTTGPNRLGVSIVLGDDDPDFTSGYPLSGWSDCGVGRSFSTTGSDWMTRCMIQTIASASTIAAGTVGTYGASIRWRTITLAILPEPAASVSPAVISRSFAMPQATVSVEAKPAAIPVPATLPQATAQGEAGGTDANVNAIVIARSFTLPQATVSVEAAPAVIARSITLPQATVSVQVAATVIARAFGFPQATAVGGTDVSPATIARAFGLPQATISVGVAPAALALAFALPQASPSITTPDATVSPAVIALAFAIPTATIVAQYDAATDKPWKLLGGGPPLRGPARIANHRPGWG